MNAGQIMCFALIEHLRLRPHTPFTFRIQKCYLLNLQLFTTPVSPIDVVHFQKALSRTGEIFKSTLCCLTKKHATIRELNNLMTAFLFSLSFLGHPVHLHQCRCTFQCIYTKLLSYLHRRQSVINWITCNIELCYNHQIK